MLTAALAIPFFVVDVPPVLDYPNHLARSFILAHPDDPILSQMYLPQWGLIPNLGMDLIGAALLQVTDVHVGGRLLLALSLFVPILGVVAYSRAAFGTFSYWPLASGTIAYNGIFHLGFMNFLLGLGLSLVAAAGWTALRRRGGLWGAAAFGFIASPVLFFCHLFGVALFGLLIGTEEIAFLFREWRSGRLTPGAVAKSGFGLALAICPAMILYLASRLSAGALAPASISEPAYKAWSLLTPFMTTNIDLTLWTAAIVLAFVVSTCRRASWSPAVGLALGILLVVYVVAPGEIKGGTFIDVRIGLMIGLLIFAGMKPNLPRPFGIVAGIVFAALIGVRTVYVTETWIDHRKDLADLRSAMVPVMPGERILVARGRPANRTQVAQPERALPGIFRLDGQIGALLVIERKAFWPLMFADPAQQPLRVTPRFELLSQPLGQPVAWSQLADTRPSDEVLKDARYLENWRANFDRVLLIDPPDPVTPLPGLTQVRATPYAVLYQIAH